ncbi:HDOD domain-containing protein [Pseudobacteriovorax antillogorgiicola]|uniref:HDOD domain-containing protein n=1 Tax=Pseudobacteriovorax antillogorgiicola TaxID=1513793 RepID=A0A1Y6BFW5_9BACT|nr:HDOD domain-containing protein [Pseudobacteriovorax antillogorgiicola]TCS56196.1 HDOD domain-containing protein [Pseudobacteriovorax antillogorgiicola]SMF08732.1 HDOD domain-containing protein [Pseudobacteriovorax antillogorgiicola]
MKKICNSCKREYHHGNDFLNNTSRWRMGPQDTLYFNCSCQSTLAMRLGKYDWYKPDINIAEGRKSLFHKLKLSEKLPPIQPAVYEIQYELSKADVSIQKVCGYLRKEPTLTATILGAASSKADCNISQVDHAIPYLGYQQVADLVLAAAMNQFKVPSRYFSWDDFWAEAFLNGRISENLAKEYLS